MLIIELLNRESAIIFDYKPLINFYDFEIANLVFLGPTFICEILFFYLRYLLAPHVVNGNDNFSRGCNQYVFATFRDCVFALLIVVYL